MLELKNVSYTVKAGQDSYDDRDHDIIRDLSLTVEEGKLIVIDGGFCKAYHEKTGIAGREPDSLLDPLSDPRPDSSLNSSLDSPPDSS